LLVKLAGDLTLKRPRSRAAVSKDAPRRGPSFETHRDAMLLFDAGINLLAVHSSDPILPHIR
jgi:hypothetical protein